MPHVNPSALAPTAILPWGDSITVSANYAGGWRPQFERRAYAERLLFTTVGSLTAGPAQLVNQLHAGFSGETIVQQNNRVLGVGPGAPPGLLNQFPCDAAVLMIGVNDLNHGLQAVTGATNASPIVVTYAAGVGGTSYVPANGDTVVVAGVGGNTAANGTWVLSAVTATTAALTGSTGNGVYTAATGGMYQSNLVALTTTALGTLIDNVFLLANNPRAAAFKLWVCETTPVDGTATAGAFGSSIVALPALVTAYNAALPALISGRASGGKNVAPITLGNDIRAFSGNALQGDLHTDGVHPIQAGCDRVGEIVYQQLRDSLTPRHR